MTPIYKSPDEHVTKAIQKLLKENNIDSTVIETKNSSGRIGGAYIKWYELWLRKQSEATQAKSVITQFEFTSFRKTSLPTSRSAYMANAVNVPANQEVSKAIKLETAETPGPEKNIADYDEEFEMPQEALDLIKELDLKLPVKRREELTPINNKRVFRRLGLLLGFSEEEIAEIEGNKLYRPWDSSSLMEKIAALKQKCQ